MLDEIKDKITRLKTLKKESSELKNSLASAQRKFKEIKGDSDEIREMQMVMQQVMDDMYRSISSIFDEIFALEDFVFQWFEKHLNGHVPNASSPSQMQKILNALGLSEDFEVKKRVIFAKNKRGGVDVTLR